MRIAVYVRGFPGSSDYNRDYTEMALRLAAAGHEVSALVVEPPAVDDPKADTYRGVRLIRADKSGTTVGKMMDARRALAGLSGQLDVFMAVEWWNPVTHALAFAASASGLPTVISPWASLNPYAIGRDRRRVAKRIVTTVLARWYGRRKPWLQLYAPVDVQHARELGLDLPHFLAPLGIYGDYGEAAQAFDWVGRLGIERQGRRVLLFNARLDLYQKGYDYLVDGFCDAVQARGRSFRTLLLLSGRDPDPPFVPTLDQARRRARAAVDTGHAMFLGELDVAARRDLIAHCDGFIYPSRVDGPPRPMREALTRGTPLVVTHETGMADWVQAYAAGVAIRSPSREAVRDAVLEFDGLSEERLGELRAGARKLADRLSWSSCWRDYEAGLLRAIAADGRGYSL